MTSSRAGQAITFSLLPARSSQETCCSVSSIFGNCNGAEDAECAEGRAPVDRLWPISHFDPVRAWRHHDAAQESIRLVDRGWFAIHRRLPTGEKGIRVDHHSPAFEVRFEQHPAG